jgi:hypothetical protein
VLIAVPVMSGYDLGYAADGYKDTGNLKGNFSRPKMNGKNFIT